MSDEKYLASVRDQYESYPYPKRNPADEKHTIYLTTTEFLGKINHYCYGGKRDLRKAGRCLVAGGGTGDAAIYLAEQLRDTDGEVVYLDLSQASMDIAKKRADVKGLTNITWHQRSILELPDMDIGVFDYINCCGVLHHLADPVIGLDALRSVLSDDGAIAVMVYAKYGRTAIYQMQELMRIINTSENNLQQCVDNTHVTLSQLPENNWYKRDEHRWKDDLNDLGDIEIYDLFLHSQDRAYTVPEVYQWLEDCNLNMIAFTGFAGAKVRYDINASDKNEELMKLISQTSKQQHQAIAELMDGNIKTHTFYVSKQSNAMAQHLDRSLVPYFSFQFTPPDVLFNDLSANPKQSLSLNLGDGVEPLRLEQSDYTRHILRYLDGTRTLGEILNCINEDLSSTTSVDENAVLNDFNVLFNTFFSYELMFVRAKEIPVFKTHEQLVAETIKKHQKPSQGINFSFTM